MTIDIENNTDSGIVRVFVVRHGQTDHNKLKILQGHVDVDINETGRDQAKLVANKLSGIEFDKFVTSDLIRCVNTAEEIVAHHRGVEFARTANLREREMGPVQGMYLKDALAKYGDNFRNLGETHGALISRIEKEWVALISESVAKGYKNVGICTHGGVLTNFFNYLYDVKKYNLNKNLTKNSLKVPFNTSISVVDVDATTKHGTIQMFGNTKHLGADLEVTNQLLR